MRHQTNEQDLEAMSQTTSSPAVALDRCGGGPCREAIAHTLKHTACRGFPLSYISAIRNLSSVVLRDQQYCRA